MTRTLVAASSQYLSKASPVTNTTLTIAARVNMTTIPGIRQRLYGRVRLCVFKQFDPIQPLHEFPR